MSMAPSSWLAVRRSTDTDDEDQEAYQSICKIGTGFSEADLEAHHSTLKALEIPAKKGYYDVGDAKPDVFFEAKVVWEVLTADLSLSPVYSAAKGMIDARGISLRFPRFIRTSPDSPRHPRRQDPGRVHEPGADRRHVPRPGRREQKRSGP